MSQNVFITGALGFLGKFFVRGLLAQDPSLNLFLLVRGKGTESPEDRVLAAGLLAPNVTVVEGDITDAHGSVAQGSAGYGSTGVSPVIGGESGTGVPPVIRRGQDVIHGRDARAPLPPIDEFWHIAGLTEFHESKREQLVKVNTYGTANMLTLAERLGAKRFFHISTAYVAGICDGPVLEDGLLPNPMFRNPYEETKYHGERIVRESNLPWTIIRPGIIMGHSRTGEVDGDKVVYGVIKTYHTLKRLVDREYRDRGGPPADLVYYVKGKRPSAKNLICVDDVARLMLLVRANGQRGSTYHSTHAEAVSIGKLHEITLDLIDADYLDMRPLLPECDDPKQRFVNKGVRVYEEYMMFSDPLFDQRNARGLDGWKPAAMDDAQVRFLIDRYVEKLSRKVKTETAGKPASGLDLSRLEDVKRFGSFTMAYDTMSRSLEAFRSPGIAGYLAYTVVDNTAMMFGDPITDRPEPLLREFLMWCRNNNVNICALQIHHATALLLRAQGLAVNKMGIETFIELDTLDPEFRGTKFQNVRSTLNIATRMGIHAVERAFHECNMDDVLRVSRRWMQTKKNRSELSILVREISTEPEPGVRHFFAVGTSPVGPVSQPDTSCETSHGLLGFIFFNPIYEQNSVAGYYANIERYDLDGWELPASFNAMKFITYKAIRTFIREGIKYVALGLSPLHDVANSEFNDNPELTNLFQQLYDESELYAFQGIATHKRLYPGRREEPVYFATAPDTASEDVLNLFKGVGLLDG